ncbi:hypothetical protein AGABI2DRAFT_73333 [Agaricus bisporus var. bisporus H97]|uniref:hypothetical protein n=1 Tax=Agaricus bisporus var. bisporus (strain H97 / ATCC MYA-4626 / FGSC 10389) TaxID=936046 RepID=UPI00029F6048|nr:hypothetical protein AGABI2DRAFT_73333 [Agaricus bisporus var. bisporus H97]EKV44906.1 hypothetical protein AGABI2DRAFT_73333 [Agaricus bisporus var. bisporus H97]
MHASALNHVKNKSGGYLQIHHEPEFVNEFNNPDLLPMMYLTLFPYGIGGQEDLSRPTLLSFQAHVKHLMHLSDRRFQEHYSFLFTVFNIIQRRKALLHTSLKVKQSSFC